MSSNPSFVLQAKDSVSFEERPIPSYGDDDVLVEVKKTGICGSDVHYLTHGRIGDFIVESPMVLGHESAGVVFKIGKNVKNVKPGDRVAIEPGRSCRKCDECRRGRYHLCPDMVFAATPPYDGTLSRYYSIPSDLIYLLPANMSLEDGALMEPTAVAVHAINHLGKLQPNHTVAIWGCGPVGLLCMAVAKALGSKRVIAVDIVPSRLEFASSYAATDTFKPPAPEPGESKIAYSLRSSKAMRRELGIETRGANAVDLVVDASGAEVSIQTGMYIVKTGGTFVGMGQPEVLIPMGTLLAKEVTFRTSFRYGPGDYALAIALASAGKVDVKPMVTHRFKFEDAVIAFEATKKGRSEDGKGLIKAVISGPDVLVDDI
ncbi:xylitol dehydrogenase [Vararia minispora EC-137]|uniref:Xylitol dehydrogenase n=1 Tax=Vararia minispora EC-137 TaxID=1314806 RepID=A0ACB8QZG9_9AGAM|nr:xylitol dehydrogenase [Vararia minispora EC-137]